MFGQPSIKKQADILQGYMDINNIIYQEQLIKDEFDKFEEKMRPLLAKNAIGKLGYEEYTPEYYYSKKIELMDKLFEDYSSFDYWTRKLKMYLLSNDKKVFENANMTLGKDKYRLSSTEILLNEEQASRRLGNLNIALQTKEMYKKR